MKASKPNVSPTIIQPKTPSRVTHRSLTTLGKNTENVLVKIKRFPPPAFVSFKLTHISVSENREKNLFFTRKEKNFFILVTPRTWSSLLYVKIIKRDPKMPWLIIHSRHIKSRSLFFLSLLGQKAWGYMHFYYTLLSWFHLRIKKKGKVQCMYPDGF